MRLLRGAKIRFDAKVKLQRATSKPGTATSSEICWFGHFDQSEELAIKSTRARLATCGYGQLNVINAVNGHRGNSPNVRAKRATTAGRQARAGENVPRTARPGVVACRWRSA